MKLFKIIFFALFFLFHAGAVAVTVNLDQTWSFLIDNMENMKYAAMFGMLLYLVNLSVLYLEIRKQQGMVRKAERERDQLKVKMYDMSQEGEENEKNIKSFGESLNEKASGKNDSDAEEDNTKS